MNGSFFYGFFAGVNACFALLSALKGAPLPTFIALGGVVVCVLSWVYARPR